MASFRAINYSLRPAKSIERKMLCEAFGRLYPFQRVSNYRYVGFGSLYFNDFSLVHHTLGICQMVSIEKHGEAKKRFEFNKPFKCIELKFDSSEVALPVIDWNHRHIVWLDYDGKLTSEVLADVATVVTRATSGTMLVVSVNAHPDREPDEKTRQQLARETGESFDLSTYRLDNLRDLLGEKVPLGTQGSDLRGAGVAVVLRQVILNEIASQLSNRNIALQEAEKFHFQPIFNFHYEDGAKMLTIGGVLFSEDERHIFESCKFEELPFIKFDENSYKIPLPVLTPREMRQLNSQLPTSDNNLLEVEGVPSKDIQNYAEVYRYFPAYHEILLL